MIRPPDQERVYLEAVLGTYSSLPGTPERPSRQDRRLARELCRRGVPLKTVRAALILAAARRTIRLGPPLPQVRTLHYFLPAIDEVLDHPLNPDYVAYLAAKLRLLVLEKHRLLAAAPTNHRRQTRHNSAVSDRR